MSDRIAGWVANLSFVAHITLAVGLLIGLAIYYLVGLIWGFTLFF